ncbi:GSCOCG00012237001-RA-CDS [Cotesia congregata]|nr:GSCOCG00012237001-RA-CDS [Cotesia congregata]
MIEQLIRQYFLKNYKISEIRDLLLTRNEIIISISTIKRILSSLGLKRKNVPESSMQDIVSAIIKEIYSCGYNLGYRSLWKKLKLEYNLTVKRDTVYNLLKVIDPDGLANRFGNKLRRRQYISPGPNFIWHLDGYDKLKQFGFAIHGCIDGFSRRVLWLEVGTTNNDPAVTAFYFLKTVKKLKFLPTLIRSDKGSENGLIGELQIFLQKNHTDNLAGDKSFIQGKSVKNQRIESYWGRMRQHTVDFYIQFFKCMQEKGLFDGSNLHIKCLQFCFGPLIRHDLNTNRKLWNEHRIRKQAVRNHLAGRPNVLFHLPHRYASRDYRRKVNPNTVEKLMNKFTKKPKLFERYIRELSELLISKVKIPANPTDALNLYKKILQEYAKFKNENQV